MMIDENLLLARGAVYKKISKGDFIFHEGTKCYFYYQLIQGKVCWLNYDDEGKIFIQSIVEPGECFGELPLFDEEPYAASALAETDCVMLQLQKTSFNLMLQEFPNLLFLFTKLLAQRVRYKFFLLKEAACHSPERRIVTLLNYFRKKKNLQSDVPFRVELTRQQIAGMTGLRVETVIRAIRNLNEQGKLVIDKGKVFLLNDDCNHKTAKKLPVTLT